MEELKKIVDNTFEREILEGLTSYPKYISSKFFYDKKGDELFQKIMELPEYYLTRLEHQILKDNKVEIVKSFDPSREGFDLIELGAGDGKKTRILLKELVDKQYDFTYKPIDISQNAIDGLVSKLNEEYPTMDIEGERGEYFEVLQRLNILSNRKKIIMVLGSNIGNLLHPKAITFLKQLREAMHDQDFVFIGMDQKKNPQKILDAYNDESKVTAAFNKNVLSRINSELGGNFDLDKFKHWETYDPETGTAKSYLVSLEQQQVDIKSLSLNITFDAWETIHTEISQKYDEKTVRWMAEQSGLRILKSYSDTENQYKNYIFSK